MTFPTSGPKIAHTSDYRRKIRQLYRLFSRRCVRCGHELPCPNPYHVYQPSIATTYNFALSLLEFVTQEPTVRALFLKELEQEGDKWPDY